MGKPREPISAQQASTLARSRSIGFSHRMALPALAAAVISSTWVSVDDAIRTASTPPSARASAAVSATLAPGRWATAAGAVGQGGGGRPLGVQGPHQLRCGLGREVVGVDPADAAAAQQCETDNG